MNRPVVLETTMWATLNPIVEWSGSTSYRAISACAVADWTKASAQTRTERVSSLLLRFAIRASFESRLGIRQWSCINREGRGPWLGTGPQGLEGCASSRRGGAV